MILDSGNRFGVNKVIDFRGERIMAKKKAESVEELLQVLVEKMADLRSERDRVEGEIESLKGEILPLMMAGGVNMFASEGVGTLIFVKGGESLSLKKGKLQGNLLKYMDAADVAEVIQRSSTVVVKNPFVQFSLPK